MQTKGPGTFALTSFAEENFIVTHRVLLIPQSRRRRFFDPRHELVSISTVLAEVADFMKWLIWGLLGFGIELFLARFHKVPPLLVAFCLFLTDGT